MDRIEDSEDEVVELGVASIVTQGINGMQVDTDLHPTLGTGISND